MLIELTQPGYLAVLAVVPLIVVLSLRSLSGLGPTRRLVAVGARCVVIAVMALALAGPEWVRTTDDQTVTFALDQSDSVPHAQQRAALAFLERAAAGLRPGKDRLAVLSFAGRPAVEQLPREQLQLDEVSTPRMRHQTNLAAALRLGLALFPGDTARRLVLLSDGNENRGVADEEIETYAGLGVPVDVVPLRYEHSAEVLVEHLAAPATAKRDEVLDLQLVVRSQTATAARLTLYRNDRRVDLDPGSDATTRLIELAAGPNRFSIPVALRAAGVHRFRTVIEPADPHADAMVVNNEGQAFTIVGAATRVLIVADADQNTGVATAEIMARALRKEDMECDVITLDELPSDPAALADTSTVILSNISAITLGTARQEMLASYVRDQGGGLIALGGDQAFSMGGYAHTPLEEVLPVETARARLKLLSLSIVIVIDRSGSMAGEKIAMARQAASGAIELLSRRDRVGVIAFNSAPEWIVPFQTATDRAAISEHLTLLGAGGGTSMYPALDEARTTLLNATTNVKHIIVLTDGQSVPGEFQTLADRCGQAGITISTIAVGPDADRPLLADIATRSGGRLYVAESARPLPQIFARETIIASQSGLFEQPFTPHLRRTADEPILAGFSAAAIPGLRGHVITAAKPAAQTSLVRPTEDGADPILAYWQAGLGRSLAFTSGLWPQWGPDWVAWPGFGKLWSQAVRYVARAGQPGDLEVEAVVRDGAAHVSVSGEHLPVRTQDSLAVTGQVIAPAFTAAPLKLQRTAAGRYEAVFPLDAPGSYLLNLPYRYGRGPQRQTGVLRTGVVQSYSPEYRTLRHNETKLAELARRTGGRVFNLDDPAAVFEAASIRPIQVRRPFWEDLLRLALILFLVDVAVRRIAVSPAAATDRVRRFFAELAGRPTGADSVTTLGALRGVKNRARTESPALGDETATERRQPARSADARQNAALPQAINEAGVDKPVVAKPSRKKRPGTTSQTEYTSRLMQAKRRARRQDEEEGHE